MIRLTRSDLADLARYPLSLQQSALALWGEALWDPRVLSVPQTAPAKPVHQDKSYHSGTKK